MMHHCSQCDYTLEEVAFIDPIEDSDRNVCNRCLAEIINTVGICSCGYRWQNVDMDADNGVLGPCPVCGDTEGIDSSDSTPDIEDDDEYEYETEDEEE